MHDFFHATHASYHIHIPKLLDNRILDSKYGWLLVSVGISEKNLSFFFFHLMTKEKICFLDISSRNLVSKFSFYSLPTSLEREVVAINNFGIVALNILLEKMGLSKII